MKYTKHIAFLFFTLGLFSSCKKETETVDVGYGYFPTAQKHYIIYQVDSAYYDTFNSEIDSFSYQVKEIIESEILDNAGRKTLRLERYIRDNANDSWEIKDVWVANKNNNNVEKTEENIKFVKLVFPVKESTKWNGNMYNTLGEQEYKYKDLHKSLSINGYTFDSTLTVVQIADSSLIEKKFQYEIYAKNVGMIYKKYVDVKDQSSEIDFSLPFSKRIDNGVDYSYTIIEYGIETP